MENHQQNPQAPAPAPGDGVVVVMVPLPAQGHLNQLLNLSRLILHYNIPVHFVGATTHNRQAKLRAHGWDPRAASGIHFHDFQCPPFLTPPPDPNSKNKFPSQLMPSFEASAHLQQPVSALLRDLSLTARKVVIVHDSLMASVVQDVPSLPNVESYTFHSISAFTIYLFQREKMGKSMEVDGLLPGEIPSLEGCFTDEFMDFISSQHQCQSFRSGSIYNTCKVIERSYMDLLEQETMEKNIKHWALGPFNPLTMPKREELGSRKKHFCLEWLDKQVRNSVIYVSFGTTTALNDDQIKELAIGLKQSGQKFIWVLRDADKGDVFARDQERRAELPKGYEDSVKDMGLVVRDWAPQLEILAHAGTGGFLSHCGWNSCMESISMGVPVATWPMHSDQPRNAVLITKILKIGVTVKEWDRSEDVVAAKVVESAVKRLMASREGDEMRKRAAELGEAVRRSVGEDGVSRREMDSFVAHITGR